jgi:hypothetical protein
MAHVPDIRRHGSHSFQFVAALPRTFLAFIDAGKLPEHLYLEVSMEIEGARLIA